MSDLISRQQPVARDTNVLSNDTISRQAAIDCADCIWYKYPPQSGGQFIHAAVPATIEETRRCELGGCDGSRKENRWMICVQTTDLN